MAKHQAVQLDVTIPYTQFGVDGDGNLVIKNKELSDKVHSFLNSKEGKDMARAEYFLLCCKLKEPQKP